MSHVWRYYCTSLCLPHTHPHVTTTYHSVLVRLPWCSFTPDLAALDAMTKLRLLDTSPRSCFVFLGRIFPSIEWKRIAASYQWVKLLYTVEPRLSGPPLSGTSIIRHGNSLKMGVSAAVTMDTGMFIFCACADAHIHCCLSIKLGWSRCTWFILFDYPV